MTGTRRASDAMGALAVRADANPPSMIAVLEQAVTSVTTLGAAQALRLDARTWADLVRRRGAALADRNRLARVQVMLERRMAPMLAELERADPRKARSLSRLGT